MNLRSILPILFLLCSLPLCAQEYHWIAGGEAGWDHREDEWGGVDVMAMGVDSTGNVVVLVKQSCGLEAWGSDGRDSVKFDGRGSWSRYALLKYSADGLLLWGREIHTLHSNQQLSSFTDLCIDRAGAVYLTGGLGDETAFSSGGGAEIREKRRGGSYSYTGVVAKYSPEGTALWAHALPELPPCSRVGTDGGATLYLLLQDDDERTATALQAFDLDGKLLWSAMGPRIASGAFGVSGDGSAYLSCSMLEPPKPSGREFDVVDGGSVGQKPSLSALPVSSAFAALKPGRRVVLRATRSGEITPLFEQPYLPASPNAWFGRINSISFDTLGRPAFALLATFAPPHQLVIAGRTFEGRKEGALLLVLNERGEIDTARWLRFAGFNSAVARGAAGTWLVAAPLLDSLELPGRVHRADSFKYNRCELFWLALDNHLNPLWGVGGGGTAFLYTGRACIAPTRDGGAVVASQIVEHAQLGGRRIEGLWERRRAGFYVARITPP